VALTAISDLVHFIHAANNNNKLLSSVKGKKPIYQNGCCGGKFLGMTRENLVFWDKRQVGTR
jgi:hypothetical protein